MNEVEYEKYIAPLRNLLFSYINKKVKNDKFLAEDLTQLALLKAYKYFQNNPIRSASYKTLLFTICNHVIIDYITKRKDKNLFLCDDLNIDDESTNNFFTEKDFSSSLIDNVFENAIISESLEELKKRNHQLYETLVEAIDDMPYSDIALKNNIPVNTVKTRVHRARKFLQKYLELKNIDLETLSAKE